MENFEVVIGLEVHVQLNTNTKIFCNCATSFGEEPNTNVCPTCLALPGALPVLNKEVLKKSIQFGLSVGATINQNSIFARKNYFYPDLPKAYQISQFELPIVSNGYLDIEVQESGTTKTKRIGITRAHMEEDAGKNTHKSDYSEVDLNRACTPLLEIVSEPDMRSSDEAIAYLKKLHNLVQFLDISNANMQEGSFRCDANVSIRPKGEEKLYTRVEIKNLNSFRFIQKAIDYEVDRQIEAFRAGTYAKDVVQETRLFDTASSTTRSMRSKEESADYRYFPDPDLLMVHIDEELMNEAKNLKEIPEQKKIRYKEMGLNQNEVEMLTSSPEYAYYFEDILALGISAKLACTFICVELLGLLKEGLSIKESKISASTMAHLLRQIEEDKISAKSAKVVLKELLNTAPSIEAIDAIIEDNNLAQNNDDTAIKAAIEELLKENEAKVNEYLNGNEKLFGFFVGQSLKKVSNASPIKVNEILKLLLKK